MNDEAADAFLFWFASKYGAENLGENLWAFTLETGGQRVPTFLFMWDGFWSAACPIMNLDDSAKANFFEIVAEHSNRSPMGITVIEDMLCIVDCSDDFNAANADEWILGLASHAAELMN